MASTSAAAGLLARQLKQMKNDKDIPGISCGLVDNSVFEWEVMLMINDDCMYYGGTSLSHPSQSMSRTNTSSQAASSAQLSPSHSTTHSSHRK